MLKVKKAWTYFLVERSICLLVGGLPRFFGLLHLLLCDFYTITFKSRIKRKLNVKLRHLQGMRLRSGGSLTGLFSKSTPMTFIFLLLIVLLKMSRHSWGWLIGGPVIPWNGLIFLLVGGSIRRVKAGMGGVLGKWGEWLWWSSWGRLLLLGGRHYN